MILHICTPEKFIQPFIEFIDENFDKQEHHYAVISRQSSLYEIQQHKNVDFIDRIARFPLLILSMYRADKIILHGLWSPRVDQILAANPWLLKKCYWVMWGGDFYAPDQQSRFKKQVIKKMGHLISYIEGDYQLVRKWYGAQGRYHECFMYPSNLYKAYDIPPKKENSVTIQIGNSADPTNNHIDILNRLSKYREEDIRIIVPLSYGNPASSGQPDYVKNVIDKGSKIFGEKFRPITDFMSFKEYLRLISEIDIAIFNHKRQQGMGNIITLLGLGKKVYMREEVSSWNFLKKHGITVFSSNNALNMEPIGKAEQSQNRKIIEAYFSIKTLKAQLEKIFHA